MKPNIVVIFTDQQNSKMMSCAGNQWVSTPNMDLLAKHGVRFTNAYCSNPVCIASRFSLMTGLYPSQVGFKSNAYKSEMTDPIPDFIFENGIGTLLKQSGYRALYGGKEHLPGFRTNDLGFDYICEDERDELAKVLAHEIEVSDHAPFCLFASFINPHDICLMAMRDHAKDADNEFDQFLVEICTTPRIEVEKAEKLMEQYDETTFWNKICPPLPDNYEIANDEPEAIRILQNQRGFKRLARKRYTDKQWRMHRWVYAKLTEQVDRQIGQVLQAIQEKGIWDNTIIIFTSDHGDMDASHKMEHKTALYQESTHVPLIIKGCNGEKGISSALVSNGLDLIPTILDIAGIEPPQNLKGKSMCPCLTDLSYVSRKHLLVESEFGRMVVGKNGCYQKYDVGENAEQYFDFKTNAGELFNQIYDPDFKQDIIDSQIFLQNL